MTMRGSIFIKYISYKLYPYPIHQPKSPIRQFKPVIRQLDA